MLNKINNNTFLYDKKTQLINIIYIYIINIYMRVINNIFNAMKSSINQFRIDYRSE